MSPTPIRIVFCGTSAFAVYSLKALLADKRFSVELVVTQPDKPAGRKQEMTKPAVKVEAEAQGLRIFQPQNINKEFPPEGIRKPDFLVVVSYGQIFSKTVLDFAEKTAVNVHASLLPRWRGAAPIQNAILAGDKETGVTVQQMDTKLDAGPVLSQLPTLITPRETAVTLHDRLAAMGAALLVETLTKPLQPTAQPEEGITICRKLTRSEGEVDPDTMTAESIDRKTRALTPWPAVTLKGLDLKVLETALEPQEESTPLPCADGTILHLVTVQPAGKKPMSGAAWARGRKV